MAPKQATTTAEEMESGQRMDVSTICSDDPEKRREWQDRGTILGIGASVGGTSCSHVLYLSAMFALIKTKHDALMNCKDVTLADGSHWRAGEYLCEYTKAYVECFPELSLTICFLVIGRNLLQQRMYYGLLERSAVLQYKAKNFFADGLVRFFLWCYAHCIGHLLLILYLIWQSHAEDRLVNEVKTEAQRENFIAEVTERAFFSTRQMFMGLQQPSVAAHDPDSILNQQIALLVELVAFFVVPATLFLVYLCLSYDLELSLVPLSGYFYDARKAAQQELQEKAAAERGAAADDSAEVSADRVTAIIHDAKDFVCSAKCDLTVIDDDALKLLVEERQEELLDARETVWETYDEIILMYRKEGWRYEKTAQETGATFIGLSHAHWPARILVGEDDHFRYLWLFFVAVSLSCQCFMCYSLSWLVRLNSLNFMNAGRWPALLFCLVVLTNIACQLWGIFVNSSTVIQWLQHGEFRRVDSARTQGSD